MAREYAEVEALVFSVERNHRLRRAPPREPPQAEPPDRPGRRVCFADPLVTSDHAPTSREATGGSRSTKKGSTTRFGREADPQVSAGATGGRGKTPSLRRPTKLGSSPPPSTGQRTPPSSNDRRDRTPRSSTGPPGPPSSTGQRTPPAVARQPPAERLYAPATDLGPRDRTKGKRKRTGRQGVHLDAAVPADVPRVSVNSRRASCKAADRETCVGGARCRGALGSPDPEVNPLAG